MKRLIFVFAVVAALVCQIAIFPGTAVAAGSYAVTSLDANSLIGMTTQTLMKDYGNPARIEPSEYGFKWYVYNSDYKNFFMAGVQGGQVVAVYTDAQTLNYQSEFRLNSPKSSVRGVLGTPLSYVRSGNTIYILNNPDQKDMFAVGDNYVIVFYDTIKGGVVTSLMIVPKTDENDAMFHHPALSSSLIGAYERISVDLVNSVRVRDGLNALVSDGMDTELAEYRSTDMRDRNYFSHYTPDNESPATEARKLGVKYTSLGENIVYGEHNAIFAHESFMNSAEHRSNILMAKYTKIGSGAAYGGSMYVILTNIFTR